MKKLNDKTIRIIEIRLFDLEIKFFRYLVTRFVSSHVLRGDL